MSAQRIDADYLVIGSGLAGLYTSLKLAELGTVSLVTKAALEESNTFFAQGGIAAALDPNDSPALHFQDTLAAGAGLCRAEAVEVLVNEGPDRVRELIDYGVPFDRERDGVALTQEAAHSRRRILHALGDATGRAISQALAARVREDGRIKIYERMLGISLLLAGERCGGILAVSGGETYSFRARAVALCTGGSGQLYSVTTNPGVATGDGIALAYQAGARVADLEFMQFHPTALNLPGVPHFLISETVRGEGGVLLNEAGVRFMPSYHELADLAPRDVVARAIVSELNKSGAAQVWLDLSALTPERIRQRFPNIYETCLKYGLDITAAKIPVAPAAHYMMGGVVTDLWGRSSLPGLFACGEVACTGVHGANRLASNSLLEDLVFARRISLFLEKETPGPPSWAEMTPAPAPDGMAVADHGDARLRLQGLMQSAAAITRTGIGLTDAMDTLRSQLYAALPLEAPVEAHELANMALISQLILQAAFLRTESRGCHYRADFPALDPAWERRIFFSRHQEGPAASTADWEE